MCDYCVEHGAGKKWYLEANNYLRNIREDDKKRRKFTTDFLEHFMTVYESFEKTGKLNQVMKDVNPNWFKKKAYKLAVKEARRLASHDRCISDVQNLPVSYIAGLLVQRSTLKCTDVPAELVDLKRVHLQLKRELRNMK